MVYRDYAKTRITGHNQGLHKRYTGIGPRVEDEMDKWNME